MKRVGVFGAALSALLFSGATDYRAAGDRWWSHIEYLASDKLEGRNAGSAGHRQAAAYVAAEFERAGLRPGGTSGYLQAVPLQVRELDEEHSSLALVRDGKVEPLTLGEEAFLSTRGASGESVEAPAVFAGYAFQVPEKNFDELKGLDLKGKIVVYLAGGPQTIPSALRAHYQSASERWKALRGAGAIGAAVIQNPRTMDIPWERASLARFQPSMQLTDAALQEGAGQRLALSINAKQADKFFAGTPYTMAKLLALADADQPLPKFPLGVNIRAKTAVKLSSAESQNVAGFVPGTDPALKNEYVVFSAHLDHVGVGKPINGDSIYNGAMDDASGVATLIEIARMFHDSKTAPKRSLLFLAVTGEEKGLLGSRFFAAHPTVSGANIVADINFDMFLPLFPLHYLEVQGLDESTLGDDIRAIAAKSGIIIQADKEPDKNRFIRSDQYSFIRNGIPALAFKFGFLPGTPEQKTFNAWIHDRYHAPSDDLNQPVDKEAAAQFNSLMFQLAERVAGEPRRPQWKSDSFFRRFAAHPS